MGCMPGRKKEIINSIGSKCSPSISDDDNLIKIGSLTSISQQNLRISKSQFVQEYFADPYERYEKIGVIGEGSYGKVFKAIDRDTKVLRAIKEIRKIKKTRYEQERIIKEIIILKKLDHPNIVKVFEIYDSEDYFYIVTELCEGGELFDRLVKSRSFTEKVAALVMKQLLSAVRFCHDHNIIHRDLKPENILLESDGDSLKIKVIDFGTGEIYRDKKFLTKQIGTPYYIAPEVLLNKYNEKCDLWSCGVIMFILLSGCPPFYGKNDDEIYAAVRNSKFTFKQKIWAEISENAKNLISNLLEVDINKRYSAEKAMKHKWFESFRSPDDNVTESDSNAQNDHKLINLKSALSNLKNFKAERKLQQATLYFMVHNLNPCEDIFKLRKIFEKMDENNDGRLAKAEIIKGFKLCKFSRFSKDDVENIMKRVDIDKSGFIEYQEFLAATLDIKKILTEDNLETAFRMFDKDCSGKISAEEIKIVLGVGNEKSDIRVWSKIIQEIDSNGDGEISFGEFRDMMYNLITSY
jgi:calcium-dependent protein kinase